MRHYILVRWKSCPGETRRTLVNLHKIVTVVDSVQGCKIHFQGYCLDVGDSFEDVCGMIEAAEAEGSRKPGDRPLMGTAARERQGEAAPQRRRGQWEAGKDGWPFCPFCGVPADIDRENFRMLGNIRAAETPFCPTCGARLEGNDANVPGSPGTWARERQGEASNSAIGQSWEEVQRELFTSEEIEESNRRVAHIAASLKGKPGDG